MAFKKSPPQTDMGRIIEQFCSRPLTQEESVTYGNALRDTMRKGAAPNQPVNIHGKDRLPVEAVVEVAVFGNLGAVNALKVLMEDQSLVLSGARQSLEGLTPLQFIAKYGSKMETTSAPIAARLLANDPRSDVASKNGGKSAAELAGNSSVGIAITLAKVRPPATPRTSPAGAGLKT